MGRDRAVGNLIGVELAEGFATLGRSRPTSWPGCLTTGARGPGSGAREGSQDEQAEQRASTSQASRIVEDIVGPDDVGPRATGPGPREGRGHENRGDVLSDGGRVRDGRHGAGPRHGPPRPRRALHLLRPAVPAGARAARRHLPRGDGAGLPALPVPAVLAGPRLADGRRRADPRHRAAARALRHPPRDLGLPGPGDPGRRPAPGGDPARHGHHRGGRGPLVPADRAAGDRAGRRRDGGERRPGPGHPRDPGCRPARSTSSTTSWT